MFHRLDDFLIDRVFQPASDGLARWISCYGVAEFLWTGVVLSRLALFVHDPERHWIASLLVAPWMLAFILECRREDIKAPSAILPVFRIRDFGMRVIWIGLAPTDILLLAACRTVWDAVQSLSWFALYAACWFMACRRNPPKPARAPVAIHAKAVAP